MKRLTLLVVLLIAHGLSFGQLIVNGNFAINSGNDADFSDPCVGCGICSAEHATFSNTSVPNWRRLFGSPNFGGLDFVSFPGCITMFSAGNLGEAIVGGYPFVHGRHYEIHICAQELINGDRIRVIAGKGTPPFDMNNGMIDCGSMNNESSCQGHIPIPNPVPSSSTTMREITHTTFFIGDNSMFFTPSDDFDWIAVFPQGAGDCEAAITISYCYVFPQDFFYDLLFPSAGALDWTSSYNPLTPRLYYTHFLHTQPNSSETKITNDPYGVTMFKATHHVLVDIGSGGDFFLATADKDGYFLAEIDTKGNFLNLCDFTGPHPTKPLEEHPVEPWEHPVEPWEHPVEPVEHPVEPVEHPVEPGVSDPSTALSQRASSAVVAPPYLGKICGKSDSTGERGQHKDVQANTFANRITVEPNPVHDKLNFIYTPLEDEMIDLIISDALGRIVYSAHFNCASNTQVHENIDVSEYGSGLYFVTVKSGKQQSVKKITKL